MKREFLQNFKVGELALPKEVIDAIMEENGRDIEAAKKPYLDYDSIKDQLKTATSSLEAMKGVDVNELNGTITKLQNDLKQKEIDFQNKLADMEFDSSLEHAVSAAKGRNAKAIRALLDVDTLKKSTNRKDDLAKALEDLKKDNGYLFESEQTPPPYASGTGTAAGKPGALEPVH